MTVCEVAAVPEPEGFTVTAADPLPATTVGALGVLGTLAMTILNEDDCELP